ENLGAEPPSKSRPVTTFSRVDWFTTVTVAPGTGVFPDFTTPAMTKFGATADPVCASKQLANTKSGASTRSQTTNTPQRERCCPGPNSEKLNRMNTVSDE